MEAVAAFSLACNVLQVAEASLKLAIVFRQSYKHGSAKEDDDAVRLSNNLSSAVGELQSSMQQPLSKDDAELNLIAQQCLDKATKLHDMIVPNLTLNSSRHRDKWKRGFKAVQLSFNNEAKDLETEIQALRKDLDTRVLISLRLRYDLGSAEQIMSFASLRADVQDFFRQQTQLQNQQHQRTQQTVRDGTAKISDQIESMHVSAGDQKARDILVNSLVFRDMNARKNQISDAHPHTFEWLFKPDMTKEVLAVHSCNAPEISDFRNNFLDWLRNDQRVYWISGKPGSGKSTLMSFIVKHHLTREYLKGWSKSQELVLIDGYLWNAAAEGQRTYQSILATLLTQILKRLSNRPDFSLHRDPGLSQKLTLMDWSIQELQKWLLHCLQSKDTYFCVFIDGLDEADARSTATANPILEFIEMAATLTNVKCCVSSRQLLQFEVAFKDCPHLRLQELNATDIRKYFDDNAKSILKSADTDITDDNIEALQDEFCTKADGVFLWARLATGSLRRGVDSCDDTSELRKRLEELPLELKDLYWHMWERANKDSDLYRNEASLFFNVALTTFEDLENGPHFSLSPLHMVFVRASNHHLIHEALMGKVSEDLERACRQIQAQIASRCAGLLEVVPQDQSWGEMEIKNLSKRFPALSAARCNKVAFVHRTARDFLLTSLLGQNICSTPDHSELQLRRLICRARLCGIMLTSTTPCPPDLKLLLTEIMRDRALSREDTVVLANDIEKAVKDRVLSSQQHLNEENWFTSSFPKSQIPSDEIPCDFLGATLISGMHWSARDKIDHCVKDYDPAYRFYLMYCWLVGTGQVHTDMKAMLDTFLEILWNPVCCSRELLWHVTYLQSLRFVKRRLRTCTADILITVITTFSWRQDGSIPLLPLSFFENLLSFPFPQDQEIFLIGDFDVENRWRLHGIVSYGVLSHTDPARIVERTSYLERAVLLQFRVSFLLQAMIRLVQTQYGMSLDHHSMEQSFSSPHPEIKVTSIIEMEDPIYTAIKIDKPESDALLALLGYDGPSGYEILSNDLWISDRESTRDLLEKIGGLQEHGERVNCVAYLKELGLLKDADDPEAEQWPPPLYLDDTPRGVSEAHCKDQFAALRDRHDDPNSKNPDSGPASSLDDSSDGEQFVDASEEHSLTATS